METIINCWSNWLSSAHSSVVVEAALIAKRRRMLNLILFAIGLVIFIRWALKPEPAPIRHIYSEKGKWYYLKFVAFYIIITLRKVFLSSVNISAPHNLRLNSFRENYSISGRIDEHETPVPIKQVKSVTDWNPSMTFPPWNVLRLYQIIQRSVVSLASD